MRPARKCAQVAALICCCALFFFSAHRPCHILLCAYPPVPFFCLPIPPSLTLVCLYPALRLPCRAFFRLPCLAIFSLTPATGDTPSPHVFRGYVLILVHASRYELGASCPKYSGLQAVPATLFPFVHGLFMSPCLHVQCLLGRACSAFSKLVD